VQSTPAGPAPSRRGAREAAIPQKHKRRPTIDSYTGSESTPTCVKDRSTLDHALRNCLSQAPSYQGKSGECQGGAPFLKVVCKMAHGLSVRGAKSERTLTHKPNGPADPGVSRSRPPLSLSQRSCGSLRGRSRSGASDERSARLHPSIPGHTSNISNFHNEREPAPAPSGAKWPGHWPTASEGHRNHPQQGQTAARARSSRQQALPHHPKSSSSDHPANMTKNHSKKK